MPASCSQCCSWYSQADRQEKGESVTGLFGDFFDFDGDGKASLFEELLGLDLLGFFDVEEDDDDEYDAYDDEDDDEENDDGI